MGKECLERVVFTGLLASVFHVSELLFMLFSLIKFLRIWCFSKSSAVSPSNIVIIAIVLFNNKAKFSFNVDILF